MRGQSNIDWQGYLFLFLVIAVMGLIGGCDKSDAAPSGGYGDTYLNIAKAYWGSEPTCEYSIVYDAELEGANGMTVEYEDECAAYVGYMKGSGIYNRCVEVVHLYGYLLGLPESDNMHSVLYHGGPWMAGVPGCKALVRSGREDRISTSIG